MQEKCSSVYWLTNYNVTSHIFGCLHRVGLCKIPEDTYLSNVRSEKPEKNTSQILKFTDTPLSALIQEKFATRETMARARSVKPYGHGDSSASMRRQTKRHETQPRQLIARNVLQKAREVGRSLGLLMEVIDELEREKVL